MAALKQITIIAVGVAIGIVVGVSAVRAIWLDDSPQVAEARSPT